jgi:hypothetical protein
MVCTLFHSPRPTVDCRIHRQGEKTVKPLNSCGRDLEGELLLSTRLTVVGDFPGRLRWRPCEASHGLYSVHPSRPDDRRPRRCPCRHEFSAELAAYGLKGKIREAPEQGTKEGAESAEEDGEKVEEATPHSIVTGGVAKSASLATLKGLHPSVRAGNCQSAALCLACCGYVSVEEAVVRFAFVLAVMVAVEISLALILSPGDANARAH